MNLKFFDPYHGNDNQLQAEPYQPFQTFEGSKTDKSDDVIDANTLFIARRMIRGEHVTFENSGLTKDEWANVSENLYA
jgi:hypothetical protein